MWSNLQWLSQVAACGLLAGLVLYLARALRARLYTQRSNPMEYYLYKIARITGSSEYEVFRRSAEHWPVSESMLRNDFRNYLLHQNLPCYVNDYIRKHRHHIDQIDLPPY